MESKNTLMAFVLAPKAQVLECWANNQPYIKPKMTTVFKKRLDAEKELKEWIIENEDTAKHLDVFEIEVDWGTDTHNTDKANVHYLLRSSKINPR